MIVEVIITIVGAITIKIANYRNIDYVGLGAMITIGFVQRQFIRGDLIKEDFIKEVFIKGGGQDGNC